MQSYWNVGIYTVLQASSNQTLKVRYSEQRMTRNNMALCRSEIVEAVGRDRNAAV
jgi:hypothetical protein